MMIFLACIVTVAAETALFWCFGYRDPFSLKIVALANVITNLSLNIFLFFVPSMYPFPLILLPEAVVLAAEYFIYSRAFGGSLRLFLITAAANITTFIIGVLFF